MWLAIIAMSVCRQYGDCCFASVIKVHRIFRVSKCVCAVLGYNFNINSQIFFNVLLSDSRCCFSNSDGKFIRLWKWLRKAWFQKFFASKWRSAPITKNLFGVEIEIWAFFQLLRSWFSRWVTAENLNFLRVCFVPRFAINNEIQTIYVWLLSLKFAQLFLHTVQYVCIIIYHFDFNPGAQPGGGAFGAFVPRKFRSIA